jgi:hypothetical protein
VLVIADPLPSSLQTNGGTVPAGSAIEIGDLRYELQEDVTIVSGDTNSTLPLVEVTSYVETFDPSSQPRQEVASASGVVADGTWHVFVGDAGNPDNEWVQVDKVAFEVAPTETYEVYFDGDGKLHIVFGDGAAGSIPADTITLEYQTTRGKAGDLPLLAVSGSIKVDIGGGLGTVGVTYANSTGTASGGADRETLDDLRVNIPAYIRTVDKALSLLDFETTALRIPDIVLAYADVLLASYTANVVRLHVWEEEEFEFTSETEDDTVSTTLPYNRYATMPAGRIREVQEYISPRTMTSALTSIERPDMAFVDVYLGSVRYDSRYTEAEVHANITAAVIAVFEGSTGFTIRIAELYNAVRDAVGVSYFYIDRVVFEHLIIASATGTVTFSGDVNPANGDTVTIDDGNGAKTFEFDDGGGVIPGNIAVPLLGTAADTLDNLRIAINSYLNVVAVIDTTAVDPTLDLLNNTPGVDGNKAIFKTGAVLAVTGMTGGLDTAEAEIIDYRRDQDPSDDHWPVGPYDPSSPASGTIVFDGDTNPADGETIAIGDGVNAETFEFDDGGGVTPGNIAVLIGGDADTTLATLKTAIEANLNITATVNGAATDPTLDLVNNTDGSVGNVDTTTTGASITVAGMSGGGTGGDFFRDGGVAPYEPIQDIDIPSVGGTRRYYDETYLYNNEIYYDSGIPSSSLVQAINLRRLMLSLTPITV